MKMIRNENCNEGKCHQIKHRIIPFKGSWSWHTDGFVIIFSFLRGSILKSTLKHALNWLLLESSSEKFSTIPAIGPSNAPALQMICEILFAFFI